MAKNEQRASSPQFFLFCEPVRIETRTRRGPPTRPWMIRRAATSMMLRLVLVAALVASTRGQASESPCAVERLENLPVLCEPNDSAPQGVRTTEACCAELRFLNDARCFCREGITALSRDAQSALVPALATAPRKCGVNPFVGEQCVQLEEEKENKTEPATENPTDVDYADPSATSPEQVTPTSDTTETPLPSPLSSMQPQVLVVPTLTPTPTPIATPTPTPIATPTPAPTPPPAPQCDAKTLLRLVQDGCAGALRSTATTVDGDVASYSSSLKARTDACCGILKALNAESCFCKPETSSALKAFPANFREMFTFSSDVKTCGLQVKGGVNCVPFPGDVTPDVTEEILDLNTANNVPDVTYLPDSPMTWPAYPAYPSGPPLPLRLPEAPDPSPSSQEQETSESAIIKKVCRTEALDALLMNECDTRIAFPGSVKSRNDRLVTQTCCENLGLLNGALCFCAPAFFNRFKSDGSYSYDDSNTRKKRLALLTGNTQNVCGFTMYAGDSTGELDAAGDDVFGPSLSSDRTCGPVTYGAPPRPPSPNSPPMPPRPTRPPAPSPPPPPIPRAPSGPTGPPGPPGPDNNQNTGMNFFDRFIDTDLSVSEDATDAGSGSFGEPGFLFRRSSDSKRNPTPLFDFMVRPFAWIHGKEQEGDTR